MVHHMITVLYEIHIVSHIWPFILILLNVLRPLFLRAHSWLNWVDEDDDEDEVGLKEKPEDTRYIYGLSVYF